MASVTAPDRRTWTVGRRWLPKRPRLPRRRDLDATDGLDALSVVDDISGIVVGIVVALTLALALILVWPLLALAIELILIVFVALFGVIGRVLFRRPWRIVAETKGPPPEQRSWDVVGWRASSAAIAEIETALRSGREPRLGSARQVQSAAES